MNPNPSEVRRVLVIDDNEAIHLDFRKTLMTVDLSAEFGDLESSVFGEPDEELATGPRFEVDSASQGQEGCQMARRALNEGRPYALAFVDMRMPPGWDGVETIRHLFEQDHDIQVVVCTAFSDYSWEQMFAKLGMTDRVLVLKKPFDPMEVSQLASALTEKWRLKRQAQLKVGELEAMVHARTHELRKQAQTDRLTALPNRAYVMDRLAALLQASRVHASPSLALLFIDFNRFKVVNDTLGHEIGDELLVEISRRLQGALNAWMQRGNGGGASFCARLGGDEFVILLDAIADIAVAERFAGGLLETLAVPYNLKGYDVQSSASIGIATNSHEYQRGEELIRDADTAMFRAKGSDIGRWVTFDPKMRAELVTRLAMENDLRRAILQDEFEMVYQPIVELEGGQLAGFEALVRWNHPTRGLIGPADFIGLAEEVSLIIPLGKLVLKRVCQQIKEWLGRVGTSKPFTINVNLSRQQLHDGEFISFLRQTLDEHSMPRGVLNLEVTESAVMEQGQREIDLLRQIQEMGIRLHIDDFGTGYSSLSCLHQMPLSCLKLDRSFIVTMTGKRDYAAVVCAIVQLAHNLGVRVVAEGIETKEQATMLQALECDLGQGYLFSKPLSAFAAEELLSRTDSPSTARGGASANLVSASLESLATQLRNEVKQTLTSGLDPAGKAHRPNEYPDLHVRDQV
ncbi:MAG TPA: EAL domain-containing protein [Phycisphaerae bacterium]|nr:EAL domain-containing protein [Phycisphaerae bacterium]